MAPALRDHGIGFLPESIANWIETSLSGNILEVKPRAGGGAVRLGAEISLKLSSGEYLRGFLAYEPGDRGSAGEDHKYSREAAILKALEPTGVRAPKLLATSAELRAHLFEFVSGEDRFIKLTDPKDAQAVVSDFLSDLALLHNLDASRLKLPGFGPLRPVNDYLVERIRAFRSHHIEAGPADPVIAYALRWLERNVPDYDGPTIIVHGDAGPGNFLFENNAMTAMLDWEQCHYGDPMEDFAWMSIRAIIQAWVPFPEMLKVYEKLSGISVDLKRIRFYRIYALLGMIIHSHRRFFQQPEALAEQSRLGSSIMFMMVHRRALAQGLADAEGIVLPEVSLPAARSGTDSPLIQSLLNELRSMIVPRSSDQLVVETAKDMARTLKYLAANMRFGQSLEADELEDLNRLLDSNHRRLADAREQLAARVDRDEIKDTHMILSIWRRVCRETEIARGSMGRLAERGLPPLV